MPTTLFLIVLLLVLVALSALFSALETAFFSLRPSQAQRLKAELPQFARPLEQLLAAPGELLHSLLIADACANVPLMIVALYLNEQWVGGGPAQFSALAILALYAVIVFACDLLPKFAAWVAPVQVTKLGLVPAVFLLPAVRPGVRLLQTICSRVSRWLIPQNMPQHQQLSAEELETLVQLSAEEGVLNESESEIIQELMKLKDKTVRDCMVPRVDVFTIADDLTNEQAIAELRKARHQRVPVCGETPDDIVGILETKAFLFDPSRPYTEVMAPPSFIPETMRALDLLRSFLRHPQGMAVIVDEFGGTEGVITLADLIEEILSDAVPSGSRELYIEPRTPGELLVSGHARLDDLREYMDISAEPEGIDTIGGLVFQELGYLPKKGAHVRLDDIEVIVRRVSRKRIEELLLVQIRRDNLEDAERGE
jgi:putative hemolysin